MTGTVLLKMNLDKSSVSAVVVNYSKNFPVVQKFTSQKKNEKVVLSFPIFTISIGLTMSLHSQLNCVKRV